MMIHKIPLFLLLLVIINGCTVHELTKQEKIRSGFTVDYAEGFADGENSGCVAAGGGGFLSEYKFMKDVFRYQNNNQYRQGWQDGFRIGKGQFESFMRGMKY